MVALLTPSKDAIRRQVLDAVREIENAGIPCFDVRKAKQLADYVADYAEAEIEDDEPSEAQIEYFNYLTAEDWFRLDLVCLADSTESPIETLLGAWLLFIGTDGYNKLIYDHAWDAFPDPEFGTKFGCQIEMADMRLDFLFKTFLGKKAKFLAVETDGHDFHERTKEQAARDRSRDRRLLAADIPVIRFTGSEVYRKPGRCVMEIGEQLTNHAWDLLAEAGKERPRRWSFLRPD